MNLGTMNNIFSTLLLQKEKPKPPRPSGPPSRPPPPQRPPAPGGPPCPTPARTAPPSKKNNIQRSFTGYIGIVCDFLHLHCESQF